MSAYFSFLTRSTHPIQVAHIMRFLLRRFVRRPVVFVEFTRIWQLCRHSFKEQLLSLQQQFFNTGAFIGYLVLNSKTGRYMFLVRYNQNWNSPVTSIKSSYQVTGMGGHKATHFLTVLFTNIMNLLGDNVRNWRLNCRSYSIFVPFLQCFSTIFTRSRICVEKVSIVLFFVWVSVHRKSILYKESTRWNFGSIVY
jgi:hypothetical protein